MIREDLSDKVTSEQKPVKASQGDIWEDIPMRKEQVRRPDVGVA